jgi:alpha-methylacyl-CoA racemase
MKKKEPVQLSPQTEQRLLKDFRIVTLANNLPGPLAVSRLQSFGAEVVKVEPPTGDPLKNYSLEWYRQLTSGQNVVTLDLKEESDREKLDQLLEKSDLLITSMRLTALEKLKLHRPETERKFPHLSQLVITGYTGGREKLPGHDLTYQALLGLLRPPEMPRTLLTDLAAVEKVVSTALALILGREKGLGAGYAEVSIEAAGEIFAASLRFGLTSPDGILGGSFGGYNLYRTAAGWIALAALETKFREKLKAEFDLSELGRERLQAIFLTKTAGEWERWAIERDLPLKMVKE